MTQLGADRIRALGPAPGYRLVDRYLPDPYRRALQDSHTPMAAVTRDLRATFKRIETELEHVQRSRSIAHFFDLDDGGRLGALHDQSPWPEEGTEDFRHRLSAITAIAMSGAASAGRMLRLAALASSSDLIRTLAPRTASTLVQHGDSQITTSTGPGQTRGVLAKPGGGALFLADVIDAPLRLYEQACTPTSRTQFRFRLDNPASATLPDLLGDGARLYPNPVFRIEASQPFGPFVLVQRRHSRSPGAAGSAPRVLVVNRRLRAGSVLHVDFANMDWDHQGGTPTTREWVACRGVRDSLYAGLAETASTASLFDNESPDLAAGYALTIRPGAFLTYTGTLTDEMVNKGPIPEDPTSMILMPSLLGLGSSEWQIFELSQGDSPDIHDARFAATGAAAPIAVTALWGGRRAGEFAVSLPGSALAPDSSGPLAHRADWLDSMIDRLKLAGTVRVTPMPDDALSGLFLEELRLGMRSDLPLGDGIAFDMGPEFNSPLPLGDSAEITTGHAFTFDSPLPLGDSFAPGDAAIPLDFNSAAELGDSLAPYPQFDDTLGSAIALGDGLSLTAEGEIIDLSSRAPLGSTLAAWPETGISFDSDAPLGDGFGTRIDLELVEITDTAELGDGIGAFPQHESLIVSHLLLGDAIGLEPGEMPPLELELTDTVKPGDSLSAVPQPVDPIRIDLTEELPLGDKVALRPVDPVNPDPDNPDPDPDPDPDDGGDTDPVGPFDPLDPVPDPGDPLDGRVTPVTPLDVDPVKLSFTTKTRLRDEMQLKRRG